MLDTIAAIATAPGTGAVGVIRVSGAEAFAIAQAMVRVGGEPPDCTKRGLHVGWAIDPRSGQRVDQVVLLVFPGPQSFTTEDVVEIQGHGGPAVMRRLLSFVLAQGARLATAGEFTRRALVGGRLDLAQAEAIADLVEARGERALEAAIGQLGGRLSGEVTRLRDEILDLLARIEAGIDFPDDVGEALAEAVTVAISAVVERVRALLSGAGASDLARQGARVALVGRPNVGKSSLLNALTASDRAIVTAEPGTTRDVVEAEIEIGGIPVRLLDTAGIRESASAVEAEGIARSRRQLEAAELRLLVYDIEAGFGPQERALREEAGDRPTLLVANKADRLSGPLVDTPCEGTFVAVSAITGAGLDRLEGAILHALAGESGPPEIAINARHRAALAMTLERLEGPLAAVAAGFPVDVLCGDLRSAASALSGITGTDLGEEILDRLFSRFCVGK